MNVTNALGTMLIRLDEIVSISPESLERRSALWYLVNFCHELLCTLSYILARIPNANFSLTKLENIVEKEEITIDTTVVTSIIKM